MNNSESAIEALFRESAIETVLKIEAHLKQFEDITFAKGHAQGRTKGTAEGMGYCLLQLLRERGISYTLEQQLEANCCSDVARLVVWFDRAISASSADEVFAVCGGSGWFHAEAGHQSAFFRWGWGLRTGPEGL